MMPPPAVLAAQSIDALREILRRCLRSVRKRFHVRALALGTGLADVVVEVSTAGAVEMVRRCILVVIWGCVVRLGSMQDGLERVCLEAVQMAEVEHGLVTWSRLTDRASRRTGNVL